MTDEVTQRYPSTYVAIDEATRHAGFTMASEPKTCALLKTLAGTKPGGKLLELGTGTGLATAWILDGMDATAVITSVDNDTVFLDIAMLYLKDARLNLVNQDAGDWIQDNKDMKFDLIFADTWHGKYLMLEEVLEMLNPGGLYILDDMLPQTNWPEGHQEKVLALIDKLDKRTDLNIVRQCWASGNIIASKR
jgi:predicted O-methyltransferase YrrM